MELLPLLKRSPGGLPLRAIKEMRDASETREVSGVGTAYYSLSIVQFYYKFLNDNINTTAEVVGEKRRDIVANYLPETPACAGRSIANKRLLHKIASPAPFSLTLGI
ncbi:unnamed protein product [Ceratitis capitata]|uniref:(Mediterranean fruit fly) hypothetical protein n=1 Tax=Ceratitis capitata TaxID=7213 RepID=A0A811UPK0_CERCA|nr:unnamed protein product [Ceratitis capitata]